MKCTEEQHFHEVKHREQKLSYTETLSQSEKDTLKAQQEYMKEVSKKRTEVDLLGGRRGARVVE